MFCNQQQQQADLGKEIRPCTLTPRGLDYMEKRIMYSVIRVMGQQFMFDMSVSRLVWSVYPVIAEKDFRSAAISPSVFSV
jgi:hypothetical protein